jgi:hypothetical protein
MNSRSEWNWQRLLGAVTALVLVGLVAALFFLQIPPVQGAIAGGLLGLVSSQGALLVQRYLRRTGDVHCSIRAWTGAGDRIATLGMGGGEGEHRDFSVNLLNERDVATALWHIRVEFYRDGVPWYSVEPVKATSYTDKVDYLDLPSQTTVRRNLTLNIVAEDDLGRSNLQKVKDSDEVKLVAEVPGQQELFEKDLPLWDAPDALPQKKGIRF